MTIIVTDTGFAPEDFTGDFLSLDGVAAGAGAVQPASERTYPPSGPPPGPPGSGPCVSQT